MGSREFGCCLRRVRAARVLEGSSGQFSVPRLFRVCQDVEGGGRCV